MLYMERAAMLQTRSVAGQLIAETQVIIGDSRTHFSLCREFIPPPVLLLFFYAPIRSSQTRRTRTDLHFVAFTDLRATFPALLPIVLQFCLHDKPRRCRVRLVKTLHLSARARRSDIQVKHSRATSRMIQSTQLLFRISKIRHVCRTLIP
jgi:hypothetical protein